MACDSCVLCVSSLSRKRNFKALALSEWFLSDKQKRFIAPTLDSIVFRCSLDQIDFVVTLVLGTKWPLACLLVL